MEFDTTREAQVGILRRATTLLLASATFQFPLQRRANNPVIMEPQIVALGGGGFSDGAENLVLVNFILGLANKLRPKVCFVPTASGVSEQHLLKFYDSFAKLTATAAHLPLFRLAATDLRSYVLGLGGGNTRNMLVLWHEWGLDIILREASEKARFYVESAPARFVGLSRD